RQHGARTRPFWICGPSRRRTSVRMVRRAPRQERGMELLRERPEPRLMGADECVRRLSEEEVDRSDEASRGGRGRVLPAAGTSPPGGALRTLVSLPLSYALLLRSPRRPRFHDGPRIRGGPPHEARTFPFEREAPVRRTMEPRRDSSGCRGLDRGVVCEASEARARAIRERGRRQAEQAD